jgi:hypothetical protein
MPSLSTFVFAQFTRLRMVMTRFETLDPPTLIQRTQVLAVRIEERFPSRGLTSAAFQLAQNAEHIVAEAKSLSQRNRFLELPAAVAVALALLASAAVILSFLTKFTINETTEAFQGLQGIDSGIHIVIFIYIVTLFFHDWEMRGKRRKALEGLHSLRVYAHVIDMHQLSKDPAALAANLPPTRSSPERDLTPQELLRYLDYCSEMLSALSKFAALYSQYSRDPVVIETVNDVESLTSSLSNKIWQKIMIINSGLDASQQRPALAPHLELHR